jgi:hypothetical protein
MEKDYPINDIQSAIQLAMRALSRAANMEDKDAVLDRIDTALLEVAVALQLMHVTPATLAPFRTHLIMGELSRIKTVYGEDEGEQARRTR